MRPFRLETQAWARPAVITALVIVACVIYACVHRRVLSSTHCTEAPIPEALCVAPGEPFPLDVSLGRYVAPGLVRLALDDVPEDSRCAQGVQCVWQGRATVRLRVDSGTFVQVVELRTDSATTRAFGYSITLDSLLPQPRAGRTVDRSAYRAWLRVTRGP